MTVTGSLERLFVATASVAGALGAARVTACEDRPPGGSTLAVEELADTLLELAAGADVLRDHTRRLVLGDAEPTRVEAVKLVTLLQRMSNEISDGLAIRVMAGERIAELERAARRGGPAWRDWWAVVARELAECEPALRELRDALFGCWQELTETAAVASADRPAPTSADHEVPIALLARGDPSGRSTTRPFADEPGGGHTK